MLKIKIKNSTLLNDLEVSHYEYNSYISILNEIRTRGYDEKYWDFWSQYMEAFAEYETLKEHLRVEIIIPIVGNNYNGNWEVNFETGEILISE
jgi:hypothetical protein